MTLEYIGAIGSELVAVTVFGSAAIGFSGSTFFCGSSFCGSGASGNVSVVELIPGAGCSSAISFEGNTVATEISPGDPAVCATPCALAPKNSAARKRAANWPKRKVKPPTWLKNCSLNRPEKQNLQQAPI